MSTERYDFFQIARKVVLDEDNLALRTRHYCERLVRQDYENGVVMPELGYDGIQDTNGRHALVGRTLFRAIDSDNLVMPVYKLEKPTSEGYRPAFIKALNKFDDGTRTVVAQVTDRITKKSLEYDNPNQSWIPVISSQTNVHFTEKGFVISAELDSPDQFIEEHKLAMQFMKFVGDMRKFKKDMYPDELYIPRIPLVRFSLSADECSIYKVRDRLEDELSSGPAHFILGQILPPKVY